MRHKFGSSLWVGLDIGSYSVKLYAVHVGALGAAPRLAEARLPAGDATPPTAEAVAEAIARCLASAGVNLGAVRGVTTGIAGPDVIVKQIQLPFMDEEEVGPALRFEARKHLPFDPQGMIIDFQVIGRYPSERRLDVLLAAVSESHLERHVAPLRSVGLEADIVDATPLALTNAVAAGLEPTRGGHVVLDVGHQSSTLGIYLRGEAYFSRRLAFGGHSITRAISDAGRIPFDEAEEWKLAAGGPEPTHVLKWDSAEMHAVVEALRRELVDELRRSFVFYQTQGSLPDPLVLYLCGGTAQLPLLAERIGELLGSAVEVFEPPGNRAAPANARGGPQYAQAFGLSLRMR